MPLDPNVPPHKTKPFWYLVAFAVFLAIAYPLLSPSPGALWLNVMQSVILSVILICMGWFAVRRLQRGQASPSKMRVIVLIIALTIMLILSYFFGAHP